MSDGPGSSAENEEEGRKRQVGSDGGEMRRMMGLVRPQPIRSH